MPENDLKYLAKRQSGMISVIIPVYNVEKYLNACLESVTGQTYKNLEIILVDDGSKDNSYEICREWEKRDSRIACVHQENHGLGAARNAGKAMAHGEYIAFVDSDDTIQADMYEYLLKILLENQADMSVCQMQRSDEKEKRGLSETVICVTQEEGIQRLIFRDEINASCCGKLFPSDLLENMDFVVGRIYEDMEYAYHVMKKCHKIAIGNGVKYNYFMRDGSISHSFSMKRIDDLLFAQENIYLFLKDYYSENTEEIPLQALYFFWLEMNWVFQMYRRKLKENPDQMNSIALAQKERRKSCKKKYFRLFVNKNVSITKKMVYFMVSFLPYLCFPMMKFRRRLKTK